MTSITHPKMSFSPSEFTSFSVTVPTDSKSVTIHGVKSNSSARPALLCLHGFPQTHHIWYKVAPFLAERFTVVATDLRGYGQSSKPDDDGTHEVYSKRTVANDQVEVMYASRFISAII
jgi:haloacetate dehalogenase